MGLRINPAVWNRGIDDDNSAEVLFADVVDAAEHPDLHELWTQAEDYGLDPKEIQRFVEEAEKWFEDRDIRLAIVAAYFFGVMAGKEEK